MSIKIFGMNWDEAFAKAWELSDLGRKNDLAKFLASIEKKEPDGKLLRVLLDIRERFRGHEIGKALALSTRLIPKTDNAWFLTRAYYYRYLALRNLGNTVSAEEALLRAMELGLDRKRGLRETVALLFFSERYTEAREKLGALQEIAPDWDEALLLDGILSVIEGNPRQAVSRMKRALAGPCAPGSQIGLWETMGVALRMQRRFGEAAEAYLNSLNQCLALGNAYAISPLSKYYEMVAMGDAGELAPETIRKVRELARKGGPAEHGALEELSGFLAWRDGDLPGAARLMLSAGRDYAVGAQPPEAFNAHVRAAFLAKTARSNLFWDALDYLLPRINLYVGYLMNDAYYSDFARGILLPLLSAESSHSPEVRFFLLGQTGVEGPVKLSSWGSRKAVTLFKYLLLNQGKGIPGEYAASLLWPRGEPEATRKHLKTLVSMIRKNLGPLGSLLICNRGAYVFQGDPRVWSDVAEFQALIKEAEALAHNPSAQLEKYLKALELYRGELLPEDRYDGYIEEHRNYFHGAFRKALARAVQSLLDSERTAEAVELAGRFYLVFPGDDAVARTLIESLLAAGRAGEAENIYEDFRKRLWREHRLRPSFNLEYPKARQG